MFECPPLSLADAELSFEVDPSTAACGTVPYLVCGFFDRVPDRTVPHEAAHAAMAELVFFRFRSVNYEEHLEAELS